MVDLERETGLNKATLRRFALTLADLGYLVRLPRNMFRLSPQILNLADAFLDALNLPDIAQPVLERASKVVKESTNMAILDGGDAVYVVRVNAAERLLALNLRVGSRLPYYATSLGKALVAWLPPDDRRQLWHETKVRSYTTRTLATERQLEQCLSRVRSQGYATADGELEIGLRSLAVPVMDWRGRVVAAVNISTRVETPMDVLTGEYLEVLRGAAREISEQIGYDPPTTSSAHGIGVTK